MGIKCCKYCVPPKRQLGCHSWCPDYLREKAAEDERKAKERKQKEIKIGLHEQRTAGVMKAYRRQR